MAVKLEPLPPKEAVGHFRKKGYAIGFSHLDVWKEEHGVAFTAAKVMRQDILEDIRGVVDKAISEGLSFGQFKNQLAPLLQKKGWWGIGKVKDPLTGKLVNAQLGSMRRLQIIFDTNLRTSYAAGRWEKIQRMKSRRPWLRYVATLDKRTRQTHRNWHGTILHADDPHWDSHYPTNGYRCRCIVQQLSDRDLKNRGYEVSKPPEIKLRGFKNNRTGEVYQVPVGIDPGFDYNVGKSRMRAFTPPPQGGGLPSTFPIKHFERPDMPKPQKSPSSIILPDGKSDDFYINSFLGEFGASKSKPVIYKDVQGEPLIVGVDLFKERHSGKIKVQKQGRHRYMKLLAQTIIDPDEVWWVWSFQENAKIWSLRRRYLKRWEIDGKLETGFSSFEFGKHGWTGNTVFRSDENTRRKNRYIHNQRDELMIYRRKD